MACNNSHSPTTGDVNPDDGELSSSTDSDADAELVRPDVSAETRFDAMPFVVLVGATVTAVFECSLWAAAVVSKKEPVNEPHMLFAAATEVTVDRIGLLTDCFMTFVLAVTSSLMASLELVRVFTSS